MYGKYAWLRRLGNGSVEIKSKPLCEFLHARAENTRQCLRVMQQLHFIEDLEIGYGYARFTITAPKAYLDDVGLATPRKKARPESKKDGPDGRAHGSPSDFTP